VKEYRRVLKEAGMSNLIGFQAYTNGVCRVGEHGGECEYNCGAG
jgi:hypothetical protein